MIALAEPETIADELLEDLDEGRAAVEPDEDLDDEDPAEAARCALLDAIVLGRAPALYGSARWAWSSVDALIAAGYEMATIEGLIGDGWLTRWSTAPDDEPPSRSNPTPAPSGLVVTLTAWGASSLGVEIRESRASERGYWCPLLEPQPRVTPCPLWLRHGGCQLELPDAVQDTAPSPLEELLLVEAYDPEAGMMGLVPAVLWGMTVPVVRPKGKVSKKKARKRPVRANVRES